MKMLSLIYLFSFPVCWAHSEEHVIRTCDNIEYKINGITRSCGETLDDIMYSIENPNDSDAKSSANKSKKEFKRFCNGRK